MNRAAVIAGGVGAAGLLWFLSGQAAPAVLSRADIKARVIRTRERYGFFNVPAQMARAIVEIESARNRFALNDEPGIRDFSAGLMQPLVSTARWLYDDVGLRAFPRVDWRADDHLFAAGDPARVDTGPARALYDADHNLYIGMGYLEWLARHPWNDGWEWTVRAYNGGPGGARSGATAAYWDKYRRAEDLIIAFDLGDQLPEGA